MLSKTIKSDRAQGNQSKDGVAVRQRKISTRVEGGTRDQDAKLREQGLPSGFVINLKRILTDYILKISNY